MASRLTSVLLAASAVALSFALEVHAEGVPRAPTRHRTEQAGNARIEIAIEPGRLALDDATLARVLGDSARGIARYYGSLPFERASIVVTPVRRAGINGSTRCAGVGRVALSVGPAVRAADFRDDWIVTHELLHVAFTSLVDEEPRYEWVGEGLSSYLEPLVRVRAGTLSEAELWRVLVSGAPQGLPEPGDEGLDRTHTWGRTYWGGALFWFEVDLGIRRETQGKKSIRDALRGIARAGTNVCVDIPMERVIAEGDRATGTHVLAEVYARRGLTNASPDLPAWWKQLGIELKNGQITFDDAAPWATLRKSMTRD